MVLLDPLHISLPNLQIIAPQRSYKTWLGSQIERAWIDEYEWTRVPEVREVPDVRDIAYSIGPFHIDKETGTPTRDSGSTHWSAYFEGDAIQLKEWLQRRGICRRTLSCGMA